MSAKPLTSYRPTSSVAGKPEPGRVYVHCASSVGRGSQSLEDLKPGQSCQSFLLMYLGLSSVGDPLYYYITG